MRWEYNFSLGRIGGLERKIVPKSVLEELIFSDFKKASSVLKDYFFIYREAFDFDSLFGWLNEEEKFVGNICSSLVEEKMRDFFKIFDGRSIKKDYLEDFFLYLHLLLEKQNSLRIKSFGLPKEERFLLKDKVGELPFKKDVEDFYSEAEKIFKEKKIFLLDFLVEKYILKFWKRMRILQPLSSNSVIFFFFAKRLNLKVVKFLLFYLFLKLNPEKIKEVIKLVYG